MQTCIARVSARSVCLFSYCHHCALFRLNFFTFFKGNSGHFGAEQPLFQGENAVFPGEIRPEKRETVCPDNCSGCDVVVVVILYETACC